MDLLEMEELYQLLESAEPSRDLIEETAGIHTVDELKKILGALNFYTLDRHITRKADLCSLVARLYGNARLFEALIVSLGETAREIIRLCAWDGMQDGPELAEAFEIPPEKSGGYGGFHSSGNLDLPAPFYLKQHYGRSVFIHPGLREIFREFMAPPKEKDLDRETNPGEFRFTEEEGEEFLQNYHALVNRLKDLGFFKRSYTEKVPKPLLKKAAAMGILTPFGFDTDSYDGFRRLRMILEFISFHCSSEKKPVPEPPADDTQALTFLKEAVSAYFRSGQTEFDMRTLLPHIRVKSKAYYLESSREFRRSHMPHFEVLFTKWPFQGWVNPEACLNVFGRMSTALPLMPDGDMHYVEETFYDIGHSYKEKVYLYSELDYRNEVYRPFFRALFVLWAALGLFELAWDDGPGAAEGDLFHAVRMTPLGRYVFGLKENYDGTVKTGKKQVTLDERFLTARVDPEDKAAAGFFRSIGTPVGNNIFLVNEELLARSCPTREDYEARFAALERYCGQSLPPVWEEFRARVMKRFVKLRIEADWVVYVLTEEDRTLADYLNGMDSPLFSRMEGRRFAVRKEDIRKFQNLLKKGGFTPLTVTRN